VEVKNTATVRSRDLRALKAFRDDYPECEPVLVYRGNRRLIIDGILCVPGDEFLRNMKPARGLTEFS
jgi:hypothetical protein